MSNGRFLSLLLLCVALLACGDEASGEGDDGGDGDGSGGLSGDAGAIGDGDGDGDAGDGDGDGDGDTSVVEDPPDDLSTSTVADVPAVLAAAYCEALEDCLGIEVRDRLLGYEVCEQSLAKGFGDVDYAYLEEGVEAGRVAFDPTQLSACHDAQVALGCDIQTARMPEACQAAFGGLVADGDACVAHGDCGARSYCKGTESCPSECARRKAPGASCEANDECNHELRCIDGACIAFQARGDSCAGDTEFCRWGDACVLDGGDAVCGAPSYALGVGASCDPAAGKYCEAGLSCSVIDADSDTYECVARAEAGAECRLAAPSQCPVGYFCEVEGDVSSPGTCKPQGATGEACAGDKAQCVPGNACVADTCRAIQRNGSACGGHVACRSGNCVDGTCAAPAACE